MTTPDDKRIRLAKLVADSALGFAVVINAIALVTDLRAHAWSGAVIQVMLLAWNVLVWTMIQYSRVWLDAKIRHARADAMNAELMYDTIRRAVDAGADMEVLMSRGGSTH